ncbi:MAG: Nuclease-related domain protein [Pelotomaculum sp. PtaU1.Bin035]|nr:MAG: Nuclease-related domain protein [Pelotomaculum sp. PtaU1.Bin035]
MAETLRWPSSLKKQANRVQKQAARNNAFSLEFLIVGFLTGAVLFFIAHRYVKNATLGFLFSLSGILIMVIIAYGRKMLSINFERDKLEKGISGELTVANELNNLPDGWFIINDTVVNGSQIDHIAIGPTGIYCIETKNWNNAGCDENGVWYRFHLGHWVPLDKSPAEQNIRHILSLKKFLIEKTRLDISLTSIVVLANPNGKFNIESRVVPPGDTRICLPNELYQLLSGSGGIVLSPDEVNNVARILT